MSTTSAINPNQFTTFGDLLKFLRRRAGLTQQELSIEVGYSESQISRLEKNQRVPDASAIAARFVPALGLEKEKEWVARLLELATGSPAKIETVQQANTAELHEFPPHNLPLEYSSFVGRVQEIAEIQRLLKPDLPGAQDVRLLTLTGAGGSGKTRLAIRVATELLTEFPDGVFFVNLAQLTEAIMVIPTIAQTLGVIPLPKQTALEAVQEHLRSKRQLLVLDNFEHVHDAGPELVALLNTAPGLKIIVTSRVVLRVTFEREYRVPPLSVPDLDGSASEELEQNDAVLLFVQRAQAVHQDFRLTKKNARAIAEICVRLDGLPLAIELAAARIRILSPQELLARLSRRFELLTGGARDLPERQQTLRNTIDWSYHLLSPAEQRLFARLGVFSGGWTLGAAEQVCDVNGDISRELIDGLQALVDHSLIRQNSTSESTERFGMLETIREFALGQLEKSGERETLGQRHAMYYLALAEAAIPKDWDGLFAKEAIVRIREEKDNLRAALVWSQGTNGNAQTALRLALVSGFISERIERVGLLEAVLSYASAKGEYDLHSRARVVYYLGGLKGLLGDYAGAEVCYGESIDLFTRVGDQLWAASSLERFGWTARERGETGKARARLEEVSTIARLLKSNRLLFISVNTLAETITMQGDFLEARRLLEEIVIPEKVAQDWWCLGWSLNHLGHISQLEGEFEQANRYHAESLTHFQKDADFLWGRIEAQHSLGETVLAQGNATIAADHLRESLAFAHKGHMRQHVAWCLAGLAGVAVLDEDPERAALLWGAAEQLRLRLGVREGPATHNLHERLMTEARGQLGDVAFAAAVADGSKLTMEEAIATALHSNR